MAEWEILIVEEMKERIGFRGPATTARRLETREIGALNYTARPPKLVSLLMWPMHQRYMFSRVSEVYLCQIKSSENARCSSSFMLHRSHCLHPLLSWHNLVTLLRILLLEILILESLTLVHLVT